MPSFAMVVGDEAQGSSSWMADLGALSLGDHDTVFTVQAGSPFRTQYVLCASDHLYFSLPTEVSSCCFLPLYIACVKNKQHHLV